VPNYLGILSLAWSYILSARLIELQPQDKARVEYSNAVDIGYSTVEDTTTVNIDIGNTSRSFIMLDCIDAEGGRDILIIERRFQPAYIRRVAARSTRVLFDLHNRPSEIGKMALESWQAISESR
jgi:hypothetical protein